MRNILLINRRRSLITSLLLVGLIVFGSIASQAEIWIGMPSHALFEELGYPTSSMKLGNREVHFFEGSRKVEIIDNQVQALYGFPPAMIKKVVKAPPPPRVVPKPPPVIEPEPVPEPVTNSEPVTPTGSAETKAVAVTETLLTQPTAETPKAPTPAVASPTVSVPIPPKPAVKIISDSKTAKPVEPVAAQPSVAKATAPVSALDAADASSEKEPPAINIAKIKAFLSSIEFQKVDLQSLGLEPIEIVTYFAGFLIFLFLIACLVSIRRSRGIVFQKEKRVGKADSFLPPTLKSTSPVRERVKIGEEVYTAIESNDPKYRHSEMERSSLSIRSPKAQREGPPLPVAPLVKPLGTTEPEEPPQSRAIALNNDEDEDRSPKSEPEPSRSTRLRLRSKAESKHPQLKRRRPVGAPPPR